MKICFHMASRYPTEKAYGVTTGESARALRALGHQVLIISYSSKSNGEIKDQYGNRVLQVQTQLLYLLRNMFDRFKLLGPIVFLIASIISSYKFKPSISKFCPDILWTRDASSAMFLLSNFKHLRVVIEVHHPPSLMSKIAIKKMAKDRKVVLLAIRETYQTTLRETFPMCEVFYGPMAVSGEFLRIGEKKFGGVFLTNQDEPLRICYVGRKQSSGLDNGLELLLNHWKFISANQATLTILGLSEAEVHFLARQNKERNIVFLPPILHSEVPNFLWQFDCGIVPYPSSTYNLARFPIKIVEYCATGLNVILTNTHAHNDIVDKEIGYFYEVEEVESLSKIISEVRADPIRARSKAKMGYEWAQMYTYKDRVMPVTNFLEGL